MSMWLLVSTSVGLMVGRLHKNTRIFTEFNIEMRFHGVSYDYRLVSMPDV